MQVDIRINEDDTQLAIYFPDNPPGYTIIMDAEGLEEFMGILWDARQRMQPPPALPGEYPLND
jgi:hypothetical protein